MTQMFRDKLEYFFGCFLDVLNILVIKNQIEINDVPAIALFRMELNSILFLLISHLCVNISNMQNLQTF